MPDIVVHIGIGKYIAGCQQTFAGDNRLSPDILLVTTGCQQTKKSVDNRLSADLAYLNINPCHGSGPPVSPLDPHLYFLYIKISIYMYMYRKTIYNI